MSLLSVIIVIIAGAILAVLTDWLLKSVLPREPTRKQRIAGFVASFILVFVVAQLTGGSNPQPASPAATSTPQPIATPTSTPTPALFAPPKICQVITGVDLPGYSKQASIVRSSQGKLIVFIRYSTGDLGYIESSDACNSWSTPNIFDHVSPPGGPGVSAAIDSADRVHIVWGRVPEAGDAQYGLLDKGTWIMTDTVGTGVFARDIAIDSANHPHVIWGNVDIFHVRYNGQKWIEPERVVQGGWHPDIQIGSTDDILLFMNNGNFYPTPGVSVYEKDNVGGQWNSAEKLSKSPFWSGGAAAAIDSQGDIYVVWIGATSKEGGSDQVFFSRYVGGTWQEPFPIGNVNTSAGSTGQESPAIAFDSNDVLYVFWRGLNEKSRPVIFARALATENSKVTKITWGWSPPIQLDDPNASDVWWPSVADVRPKNRVVGVDLVWSATVGKNSVIEYSHVTYP